MLLLDEAVEASLEICIVFGRIAEGPEVVQIQFDLVVGLVRILTEALPFHVSLNIMEPLSDIPIRKGVQGVPFYRESVMMTDVSRITQFCPPG